MNSTEFVNPKRNEGDQTAAVEADPSATDKIRNCRMIKLKSMVICEILYTFNVNNGFGGE